MPNFLKLTDAQVRELSRRRNNIEDIGEYLSYLQTLKSGDLGRCALAFTVAPHLQTINYRGRFSRFVSI